MREIPNSLCDFVAETGAIFCENWIKNSFVTKFRKFKPEFTFKIKNRSLFFFEKLTGKYLKKRIWHLQQIDVILSPLKSSSI